MVFLTQNDFETAIKADNLNQIIQNNVGLLDAAVLAAVQEVQSYLKVRFDVAAIFGAEAEARNAQVVMYTIDIALYHIHARVAARQMPESRLARYEQACNWLKAVNRGVVVPDLPTIASDESASLMWGSNNTQFRY